MVRRLFRVAEKKLAVLLLDVRLYLVRLLVARLFRFFRVRVWKVFYRLFV